MKKTEQDLHYGKAPEGAEIFSAGKFYPEIDERIEFYVTGTEPDSSFLTLNSSTGKLLPNNQVNITKPLASRLNIKAGDYVSCINKEDGKSYTIIWL